MPLDNIDKLTLQNPENMFKPINIPEQLDYNKIGLIKLEIDKISDEINLVMAEYFNKSNGSLISAD